LIPILLLDIFIEVYHHTCFPSYSIRYVRRREYIITIAIVCNISTASKGFTVSTVVRQPASSPTPRRSQPVPNSTGCPIKHAEHATTTHSRYHNFVPYGDAENYQRRLEELRKTFKGE